MPDRDGRSAVALALLGAPIGVAGLATAGWPPPWVGGAAVAASLLGAAGWVLAERRAHRALLRMQAEQARLESECARLEAAHKLARREADACAQALQTLRAQLSHQAARRVAAQSHSRACLAAADQAHQRVRTGLEAAAARLDALLVEWETLAAAVQAVQAILKQAPEPEAPAPGSAREPAGPPAQATAHAQAQAEALATAPGRALVAMLECLRLNLGLVIEHLRVAGAAAAQAVSDLEALAAELQRALEAAEHATERPGYRPPPPHPAPDERLAPDPTEPWRQWRDRLLAALRPVSDGLAVGVEALRLEAGALRGLAAHHSDDVLLLRAHALSLAEALADPDPATPSAAALPGDASAPGPL